MARTEILAVGTGDATSTTVSITTASGPKKVGIKTSSAGGQVPANTYLQAIEVSGSDDMPMRVREANGTVRQLQLGDGGDTSINLVAKGDYKFRRFGPGAVGAYVEDGAP